MRLTLKQQEKEKYHAEYEAAKKRGHPFFPDTVFKDALAALLVLAAVVALALIFGAELEPVADPTDTTYVPRPEWYFLFLFEMLKFFPGELEPVGAVFIPTIAVLVMFLLPFIDRNPKRKPLNRPVATGIMTLVVVAIAYLGYSGAASTPPAVEKGEAKAAAVPAAFKAGERLYREQKCASCHTLNGEGNAVGPDLTHVGDRRDSAWLHTFLENPKGVNPNSVMPSFLGPLSHAQVEELSVYLASLK